MASINSKSFFTSLMIIVALFFGVGVQGAVHKIGDSSGWTMMGVDYQAWASSRTFQVGDSLIFEYNNELHDVTEVTPHDFELCYSSNPLARYQTGSDTVTLTKPGFQHFICGVPGHCDIGQKLDILVFPASLGPVAAPIPGPVRSPRSSMSPSPSPLADSSPSPLADSPTSAPQFQMGPSPL
ncbi:mavicyanin-like [Raphanus sativus]|uniref:Mavicyanin-like n=1 Tax=Raphanus sativus TaxID=3726 RepID=A0A6J0N5D6_RAPSA|nr:mavicyanin-like [Raphanus sativus]